MAVTRSELDGLIAGDLDCADRHSAVTRAVEMVLTATSPPRLAEIAAASPETLGLVMLEADPHGRRLDRSAQSPRFRDALADGAAAARNLRERFPGTARRRRSHDELGVPVETTDDDPHGRLDLAICRIPAAAAAHCAVQPRAGARSIAQLTGSRAARLLGQATLQDVFIAHELYHHIEAIRPDVPIARRHQPTLFRIGNWHWRTGIAALGRNRRRRICAVAPRPALPPEGAGPGRPGRHFHRCHGGTDRRPNRRDRPVKPAKPLLCYRGTASCARLETSALVSSAQIASISGAVS